MSKEEIIKHLTENHNDFIKLMATMNERGFMFSINDKWTAGQQLFHIVLSVSPLTKIFLLPAFLIKIIFGKANRPSKDYESLIKKYLTKIEKGGKATRGFIPPSVEFKNREKLSTKLLLLINKLKNQVDGFSEKQLDELILPHPLLGKLTLREMLMFTVYHVQHHHKMVLQQKDF